MACALSLASRRSCFVFKSAEFFFCRESSIWKKYPIASPPKPEKPAKRNTLVRFINLGKFYARFQQRNEIEHKTKKIKSIKLRFYTTKFGSFCPVASGAIML